MVLLFLEQKLGYSKHYLMTRLHTCKVSMHEHMHLIITKLCETFLQCWHKPASYIQTRNIYGIYVVVVNSA